MKGASMQLIIEGALLPEGVVHNGLHRELSNALKRESERIGFTYVSDMEQYLSDRDFARNDESYQESLEDIHRQLPSYHLLEVPRENLFLVIAQISRSFSNRERPELFVELIEPTVDCQIAFPTAAQRGVDLTSAGSSHSHYIDDLGIEAAWQNTIDGKGTRIAVLDTGVNTPVKGWHDLTLKPSPNAIDCDGHGSTMAAIIASVAPGSEIHAVRVTEFSRVRLWDLMAGLITAVFYVHAHIVNLSLGFLNFEWECSNCGGNDRHRSLVFRRFFHYLCQGAGKRAALNPVFLAAVGNNGRSFPFQLPAAYDDVTVAIGSVNHDLDPSAFSNAGSGKKGFYFLCPGGDKTEGDSTINDQGKMIRNVNSKVKEGVGENKLAGTSVSTAYASGVLALYRHSRDRRNLSTDPKDVLEEAALRAIPVLNDQGMGRLVYESSKDALMMGMLIKGISDERWEMRNAAFEKICACIEDGKRIELITKLIKTSPYPDVRQKAMASLDLAEKNCAKRISMLKERIANDEDWAVKRYGVRLLAGNWIKEEPVFEFLREFASSNAHEAVRIAALLEVVHYWRDDRDSREMFLEKRRSDGSPAVCLIASLELARMRGEDVQRLCANMLLNRPTDVCTELLKALTMPGATIYELNLWEPKVYWEAGILICSHRVRLENAKNELEAALKKRFG
jgi:hypothetical protein